MHSFMIQFTFRIFECLMCVLARAIRRYILRCYQAKLTERQKKKHTKTPTDIPGMCLWPERINSMIYATTTKTFTIGISKVWFIFWVILVDPINLAALWIPIVIRITKYSKIRLGC